MLAPQGQATDASRQSCENCQRQVFPMNDQTATIERKPINGKGSRDSSRQNKHLGKANQNPCHGYFFAISFAIRDVSNRPETDIRLTKLGVMLSFSSKRPLS